MQLSSKIVRNSIANYGGTLVSLVVGFLLTPFLVHSLGDAEYGAWVLVGSIGSYFWLLDFGLGASVTKFVSELRTKGERERLNSVVASSVALLSVVGVISLLGSLAVAQLAELLFRLPPEIVDEVRAMICITGVAMLVSFPLGVYGGVLQGNQRYDLINVVGIAAGTTNALLAFAVVQLDLGLVGLSAVGLLTNLLVGFSRWRLSRWVDPGLEFRLSLVRLSTLREITGFSVWVFVINVAVQVVYRTGPIVIASLLSVALVTPYAIANSLVQYLGRFVNPVLAVLLPAYAELRAGEDGNRAQHLFIEGSRAVGAIAMPMILGVILLGRAFIQSWMGPSYEQSADILYVLVLPLLLSFLVATGDKLLWAAGKVRVNSYVAVVDMALNLTLSVTLAQLMGVMGVAVATLLSVLATNGLWLLPYICREAGVPFSRYLGSVVKPLMVPVVPSGALVLLVMQWLGSVGYLQLAVLAVVCAASYWLTFLALGRREERLRWWSVVRNALFPSRAPDVRGVA